jgi:hypothetical protein
VNAGPPTGRSVTSFEYLSVLISVIVGLGLSHPLTSAARLIQRRRRIRLHAPTLLWMATGTMS